MLQKSIEKEIETDHKVLGRFNVRETICIGGIILTYLFFYISTDSLIWAIVCEFPLLIIFGIIGWYKKFGLNAEDVILKKLMVKIYKNTTRKYRTMNSYFMLFNNAYANKHKKEIVNTSKTRKGGKNK